jgi:D-sedoheptulose 7-phosphate isomerase
LSATRVCRRLSRHVDDPGQSGDCPLRDPEIAQIGASVKAGPVMPPSFPCYQNKSSTVGQDCSRDGEFLKPATGVRFPSPLPNTAKSWHWDMSDAAIEPIIDYLARSRDAVTAAIADPEFVATIAAIVERIASALAAGYKLLLAGNGGSAADAQHLAGEFLSRLNYDRAPAAAIALTTDTSVLTAIGNDYGYEHVFERQVLGLGRTGDVLIALSTSGRSPNILKALAAARKSGVVAIGFTGSSGGVMAPLCDLCLRAPSDATPLIQQLHITAGHIICGLVEQRLFPRSEETPP